MEEAQVRGVRSPRAYIEKMLAGRKAEAGQKGHAAREEPSQEYYRDPPEDVKRKQARIDKWIAQGKIKVEDDDD